MSDHARRLIAGIVAELHGLYRGIESTVAVRRVETIDRLLGELKRWVGGGRESERWTRGGQAHEIEEIGGTTSAGRMVPELVSTDSDPPLAERIVGHLAGASAVRIASAFLSAADTNPLILPLRRLSDRNVPIRVLTSVMGFFNSPDALAAFAGWGASLDLHLHHENPSVPGELFDGNARGFHAKTILIEKDGEPNVVVVGSANMTGGGMGANVEWDYLTDFEVNVVLDGATSGFDRAVALFDALWDHRSYDPDERFIERYRGIWARGRVLRRELADLREPVDADGDEDVSGRADGAREYRSTELLPNHAQEAALRRLTELRDAGVRRCAVIAATGIGKTILSAFDVAAAGARRVLFVAHRRAILEQAREGYERVLGDRYSYVIVQGRDSIGRLSSGPTVVFAMVQTLAQGDCLRSFASDSFDYVVVDEFHHAAAATYARVIEYFSPRHLLGMTATPERSDGQDVLRLCNRNVAYEVRLFDAVDRGWLVPFQYFAIYDPTDYEQIRWTGTGYDENELERALSGDTRADLIVANLNAYQSPSGERRVLAFCSNVGHARWMSRALTRRGIAAEALTGETSEQDRTILVSRLEDPEEPLEVVCTVDVLSEGVDIPSITHILMLRPTQSFTVFQQQLGRGLRRDRGKSFLVVLDFVGNYRKSYVAPLALSGHFSIPDAHPDRRVGTFRPPRGCYASADIEVTRIWRDALFDRNPNSRRLRRIRDVLEELAEADESGGRRAIGEVRLPELFTYASAANSDDIVSAIRALGGWLGVRDKLGEGTEYERGLMGTDGERFLRHVEHELLPNRSYKFAVFHCLLDTTTTTTTTTNNTEEQKGGGGDVPTPTRWNVGEIAPRFLGYYLADRRRIPDWPELAAEASPDTFPMKKVVAKLKAMPLKHLSNGEKKVFVFSDDTLRLKDAYRPFWADSAFRRLVRERVEYAEARYWNRSASDKRRQS